MAQQASVVKLQVNGTQHRIPTSPNATLLEVLREELGLTGTKHGCESGECGACTVLVDGEPILSCLRLATEVEGKEITTVEGLGDGEELDPIQDSFIEHGAAQCGYCTAGMLMTGKHLLEQNPDPTREEIRDALAGNICRCTGYEKIIDAIEEAERGEIDE